MISQGACDTEDTFHLSQEEREVKFKSVCTKRQYKQRKLQEMKAVLCQVPH